MSAGAGNLVGVVAMGESAGEVDAAFAGRVPVTRAPTIEDAVRAAFGQATRPGVVLLAPGCASWDQFTSYIERGDRFAAAARALRPGGDGRG